jgi:hypothetical protein
MTRRVREELDRLLGQGKNAEEVARQLLEAAKGGDMDAIKLVMTLKASEVLGEVVSKTVDLRDGSVS